MLSVLAAAVLLWNARAVVGVASTNATCASNYRWMNNAEGQIPCLVASKLQGVCYNNDWFVPALPSGLHYVGPSTQQANLCICNTVVYNLISACGACQEEEWVTWPEWVQNCSASQMTRGRFPAPIPGETSVPAWALVDTSFEGSWNEPEAYASYGSGIPDTFPSVTSATSASTTSSASSTSTTPSSTTSTEASPTSTTTPLSDSSSKQPIGAIVGGVVGGVGALLIIAGILIFLFLRRRKARRLASAAPTPAQYSPQEKPEFMPSHPGSPYNTRTQYSPPPQTNGAYSPPPSQSHHTGSPPPQHPQHGGQYTLYDPSNPATWPTGSASPQPSIGAGPGSPRSPQSPTRHGMYTGAAEI